jgi:hypothetical protein
MSMEEWTGFELNEQVLEDAALWISKLDEIESPELSDFNQSPASLAMQTNTKQEVLESFNQWFSSNIEHQQAYAEMSLLWAKSACIHEISDRLCASNVFAFPLAEHLSSTIKEASGALPHTQILLSNEMKNPPTSPAWAYTITIGLILVGLCTPIAQQIL